MFQPIDFDWDAANLSHIARHRVEPEEAEEAATDPAGIPSGNTHRGPQGQRRAGTIGATEDGRVLLVIFEFREHRVRVVTAYDASSEQRARYYSGVAPTHSEETLSGRAK